MCSPVKTCLSLASNDRVLDCLCQDCAVPRPRTALATTVGLWVITRVVSVALLKPMPWIPYDVKLYESWARGMLHGSFPFGDAKWQYPDPLAAVLVLPTIPGGSYIRNFTLLALMADAAIMVAVLLYRRRSSGSWRGPILWATAGIWIGPVMPERPDIFPTLLAVLSLVVTTSWLRAVLSGLGFGLKLWPGVTMLSLTRSNLKFAAPAFAATVVGSFGLIRLRIPLGDSFVSAQAGRGLHAESVAAAPFVAGALIRHPATLVESNGTLEVIHAWAESIGLVVTALGILIVVGIALLRWTGRLAHVQPIDICVAALLVLLVSSRVFSPQFFVWLAGLMAVALVCRQTCMGLPCVFIVLSAVVTQYIYPLRTGFPAGETDAVIAQLLRVALILCATGLALKAVLWRKGHGPAWVRQPVAVHDV